MAKLRVASEALVLQDENAADVLTVENGVAQASTFGVGSYSDERAGVLDNLVDSTATTFLTLSVPFPDTLLYTGYTFLVAYSGQIYRQTSTRTARVLSGMLAVSVVRVNNGADATSVNVAKVGTGADAGSATGATITFSSTVTGSTSGTQMVAIQVALATTQTGTTRRSFGWRAIGLPATGGLSQPTTWS